MTLRFLLDEQLRGPLWKAVQRHNSRASANPIDVLRVGDPPNLPRGTSDPDILLWAQREDRILVSADARTMLTHFRNHLAAGHHSPGLFITLPHAPVPDVLDFLVIAVYASHPDEWRDRIEYIG